MNKFLLNCFEQQRQSPGLLHRLCMRAPCYQVTLHKLAFHFYVIWFPRHCISLINYNTVAEGKLTYKERKVILVYVSRSSSVWVVLKPWDLVWGGTLWQASGQRWELSLQDKQSCMCCETRLASVSLCSSDLVYCEGRGGSSQVSSVNHLPGVSQTPASGTSPNTGLRASPVGRKSLISWTRKLKGMCPMGPLTPLKALPSRTFHEKVPPPTNTLHISTLHIKPLTQLLEDNQTWIQMCCF